MPCAKTTSVQSKCVLLSSSSPWRASSALLLAQHPACPSPPTHSSTRMVYFSSHMTALSTSTLSSSPVSLPIQITNTQHGTLHHGLLSSVVGSCLAAPGQPSSSPILSSRVTRTTSLLWVSPQQMGKSTSQWIAIAVQSITLAQKQTWQQVARVGLLVALERSRPPWGA